MIILTSFSSGFWTVIGVFTGIVVFVIVALFIIAFIYAINHAPKMKIYRGDKLMKDTYAPMHKHFRKYLEKMHQDESYVITPRDCEVSTPILDLLKYCSCKLDKDGRLQLVGFDYADSLYLTISDNTSERLYIKNKLGDYLRYHTSKISEEEYKKLSEKDWWKMKQARDPETDDTTYTITRTELPEPVEKRPYRLPGGATHNNTSFTTTTR